MRAAATAMVDWATKGRDVLYRTAIDFAFRTTVLATLACGLVGCFPARSDANHSSTTPAATHTTGPSSTALTSPAVSTARLSASPVASPTAVGSPTTTGSDTGDPTPTQRHVAYELTSIFENDTPDLRYGYVADLYDGRGYTAGFAGFCSATGDLLQVVQRYAAARPETPLAAYLPTLQQLADTGSDSITGLDGFPAAFRAAATDPAMQAAQQSVVTDDYWNPAIAHARSLGLHTALSAAVLYDSEVQHGDGADPDGVPALITRTLAHVGTPTHIGETAWLDAFLTIRRTDLTHAYDPATRAEWAASVDRVDALAEILHSGNLTLALPITIDVPDWTVRLDR